MKQFALLAFAMLTFSPLACGETITQFQATLTNSGVYTLEGEMPPDLGYAGTAKFTLTEPMDGSSPTLEYEIRLTGFDTVFGGSTPRPTSIRFIFTPRGRPTDRRSTPRSPRPMS